MYAGVSCVSVHPGNLLATALHRHSPLHWLASRLGRPWAKSPSQAAASTVMACCSDQPLLLGPDQVPELLTGLREI